MSVGDACKMALFIPAIRPCEPIGCPKIPGGPLERPVHLIGWGSLRNSSREHGVSSSTISSREPQRLLRSPLPASPQSPVLCQEASGT